MTNYDINFEGQVAVITGAGAGLGKSHALEFGKRGAKVVVNDFGGSTDGSSQGAATPADKVVEEIKSGGGEAVANYDNVATAEGGENIVKTAVDAFGKVDILVNNAGILRDKSFIKTEPENWDAVVAVHLRGSYCVSRPAFKVMRENGYGRIIMTTSGAGLYGNFGQSNYAAAKMGVCGLMNVLKLEGAKYNIKTNTIAPVAASRLTEGIIPPDVFEKMKPEYVTPIVIYLCSKQCNESGYIYNAAVGKFSRVQYITGKNIKIKDDDTIPAAEEVMAKMDQINSLENGKFLEGGLNDLMTEFFA